MRIWPTLPCLQTSAMSSQPDFINQYILTKAPFIKPENWKLFTLGDYSLYTHPVTEITHAKQGSCELIIIGSCYDYRNPEYTNQQIADNLTLQTSVEDFLDQIQHLSGIYLLIWKTPENFLMIPDLASLREIFIDHNRPGEVIVAASPNLINLVQPLQESGESFYTSKKFVSSKVWVHDKTNYTGITRLKPNHLLNVNTGIVTRFFPVKENQPQSLDTVVEKTRKIMPGILKAVYLRNPKLMLGLTGGWDSRFLLAASRDIHSEITFFINRHNHSTVDCKIAARLANKFDLQLYELRMSSHKAEPNENFFAILPHASVSNYQVLKSTARDFSGYKTISGVGSEVARNFFGRINNLTGAKLAALAKYPNEPYCVAQYDAWLQNESTFKKLGYHPLDIFYWEESLGNRVAKSISEGHTAGVFISPAFTCRFMLYNFLSVDEKYRDKQTNLLYTEIIKKEWKEVLEIPVNPGFKKQVIMLMQKLGIYNLYRNIFTTGVLGK